MIAIKALATTLSTSILSNSLKNKIVDEKILENFVRGMRELKIEMNVLKKNTRSNSSRSAKISKEFVVKCIWCDDPNHKCSNCGLYTDVVKNSIITFKKEKKQRC